MRLKPDHVTVSYPADMEAPMIAFYGEALGLTRVQKTSGRRDVGAWFVLGGMTLHLSPDPVDPTLQAANPRHLAFATDDLDGVAERIRVHGGWLIDDPRPPDTHRRLFACDPAGNRLEIFEDPSMAEDPP